MKITFYGTGSAFNHDDGNNSALLEFDNTNLLLDCGHTVPNFLQKRDILDNINNIWISHLHGDHIGGLEEIAFYNKIKNGKKINLFIQEKLYNDLESYLMVTLKHGPNNAKNLNDYFNIRIVKTNFNINNEHFFILPTDHFDNCNSYMLQGNRFIFTGDTKFINWTKRELSNIDFIFHDIQFIKYGNDVHATLEDILELPTNIKLKIKCMHYSNDWKKYINILHDNGMELVQSFKQVIIK